MIYNILIVGAGQLGSRHLQSVKQTNFKTKIFVYDISTDALRVAKERYEQVAENENIEGVEFVTSLNCVEKNIDFSIIATGSGGRAEIISQVLDVCCVKYMLIEKVLFQSLSEYETIQVLLDSKKVQAWVNCPRRMNFFYKELSALLKGQTLSVTIEGYQWSFGCNAIHYIDLIGFLCHCEEYSIEENLDKQIQKSKRDGYFEFTGEVFLKYCNGTQCRIISHSEDSQGLILTIVSKDCRLLIDESKGEVFISRKEDEWKWYNEKFTMKYQSELTAEIFENLIIYHKCDLTPYKESVKLHKPFIEILLAFLSRNYQKGIENCPIT